MATVSFVNMDQAFSVFDTDFTTFSAVDAANSGFQYSYLTLGGDDWEFGGTGLTQSAGLLNGGTVTTLALDVDNDNSTAELSITGLNVAAANFGIGSGNASTQRNAFWRAALSGNDTVDFNRTTNVGAIVFAADGANIATSGTFVGGNDTLSGGSKALAGGSIITGDFYTVNSGTVTGGADTITVAALNVIGDFYSLSTGITATGGADTIAPTRLDGNLTSVINITGDVLLVSGTLNAGNDLIDLRNTNVTGYTGVRTRIYGDALDVAVGATLNAGNDTIHGSSLIDEIFGDAKNPNGTINGGNDLIFGYGGNDIVYGGTGNDTVNGGVGADLMFGEAGSDFINGGDGYALSANGGSVYRLYEATLDRNPDVQGFSNWVNALNGGQSLASITTGFINSTEFQTVYGALNNTQFVTLLYNNVLDRAPDQQGLNNWVSMLNSGTSRETVVNGFSESVEFKNTSSLGEASFATFALYGEVSGQVFRLYQATLARSPDEGGFTNWANALVGGQSLASITTGFINSVEFNSVYGALNNTQFVTLLYNNVLNRAPDQQGLNNWVSLLNSGTSREAVVNGFSESNEFKMNTASTLTNFLKTGLPSYQDYIEGGAGDDFHFGGIGADTFAFMKTEAGTDQVFGYETIDTLNLLGFGYANSAAALTHFSQVGSDVIFSDQGQIITFHDTQIAVIQASTITVI